MAKVAANNGEKGEKYHRILAAAQKIFAQNGFHNSKVAQIAKEANVADGTIYLYFHNKDDILISLFEDRMRMLIDVLRKELATIDSLADKIRAVIRLHFRLLREDPDLIEIITIELRQSTMFMKEYQNQQFRSYLQVLGDLLKEGKDQGLIRQDVSPGLMKRALFGMMDEISLLFVLSHKQNKYSIENVSEELSEFFLRGIWYDASELP